MNTLRTRQKVILFTCSWHAYSCQEEVGRLGKPQTTAVIPIRLSCLGRISPGIILKAFENGAAGVLLLGCPEGHCRYESGNLEARKVVEETKSILKLLGYEECQLDYQLLPAENPDQYLEVLHSFMTRIQDSRVTT